MTLATQLLLQWRSRPRNRSEPEPGLDENLRIPRGRRSNDGLHPREDADSSRRSHRGTHHGRHLSDYRASSTIWLDHRGTSEFEAGSRSSGGIQSPRDSGLRRTRYESDDRLPGAVVQAQERVLERLWSLYATGSRQSTSSLGISQNERSCGDDLSVLFSGELTLGRALKICDMLPKPTGLSWDKLGRGQEVFRSAEEGGVAEASLDCCICLERFLEGDGLIRLLCGHRFHASCLEPWLRTHSHCPYCRSSIFHRSWSKRE